MTLKNGNDNDLSKFSKSNDLMTSIVYTYMHIYFNHKNINKF